MARRGQLPAVRVAGEDLTRAATEPGGRGRPVLAIRPGATLIEAASPKAQAAGHYKGGFGFHPPDQLVCQHRGRVGGDGAPRQRRLVHRGRSHRRPQRRHSPRSPPSGAPTCWSASTPAGASHDVIDHLTSLNTAPGHGNRGRRVEYTIGWPLDEPTVAGIEQLPESDWGAAVHTDGALDPAAQVADLTGIMRHPPGADRLATWPGCMRLIARRTPRPATTPAKLGEHPDWEYGAFSHLHPRRTGPVPRRPTPHPGPRRRPDDPSSRPAAPATCPRSTTPRNAAWLQLAALATSLTAWLRHLALDGDLAKASTKTLRFRLLSAPARLVTHARRRILKIPPGWKWSGDLATAWDRLQALHPI